MTEGAKVDLVLHDVDEVLVRQLEAAAAAHGRSVEQEHRTILSAALVREPAERQPIAARRRSEQETRALLHRLDRLRQRARGIGLGASAALIGTERDYLVGRAER